MFVDKVYLDASQGKRRKKIIIISIIAVVIIAIIIIAVILYNNRRERILNDFHIARHSGIEYSLGNNFYRAKEELQTAYTLAEKLRDSRLMNDIKNYTVLVDSIIRADSLLESKKYQEALEAYEAALIQSKYADNLAQKYIEDRMKRAGDYLRVHDLILLGDTFADNNDWDNARLCYIEARNLASRLYYTEGRKEATEALEAMIKLEELHKKRRMAAEFTELGEDATINGTFISAKSYFTQARDLYVELDDKPMVASIDKKLGDLEKQANTVAVEESRNEDIESRQNSARNNLNMGDEMTLQRKYSEARIFYQNAYEIYADLGEVDEMLRAKNKAEWAEDMEKEKNITDQLDTANRFVNDGDEMMDVQKYSDAKIYYQMARNIYSGLDKVDDIRRVNNKIDRVDQFLFPDPTITEVSEEAPEEL